MNTKALHYLLLLLLTTLFLMSSVQAAQPAWPQKPVSLNAQERPLADFIQDFFGSIGMIAAISPSVKGKISGQFNGNSHDVFNDIVRAYSLLSYYDGSVMHISTATEIQSKKLNINPKKINDFIRLVDKLDLRDNVHTVKILSKKGVIQVRGTPEFISDVEDILSASQASANIKPEPVRPASYAAASPQMRKIIFRTFQLKYASAGDITHYQNGREITVPGVVSLLRNLVGSGGYSSTQPYTSSFVPNTVPEVQSDRFKYANLPANQPTPVNAAPQQTAAVPNGGGIARIESDRSLNAIIVRDYEDAMPLYEDLINQLDKEPQLIEINVTIIDVDKNKLDELGVDWRYRNENNTAAAALGAATSQQGNFTDNGGLLLNTVLGSAAHQVLGRVRALATTGNAKVVSQPQVATLSNMEAVLASDQSFYVRVAGAYEVDLFNVTVGTSLRVTPQIVGDLDNPQVKMVITIEDGKVLGEQFNVEGIPSVERSSLNTQAIIHDGESLLLGGLVKESELVSTTKVPLLGDIPIAGNLFKRTEESNARTERLFLIEPRISQRQQSQVATESPEKTFY